MSRKPASKAHKPPARGQNHVRNHVSGGADTLDEERLKNNLSHLVGSLSGGGKVQAYEQIAGDLSRLAGLNGNSWTWRYVASVHSGSVGMSKKFTRVLALLLEEIQPRAKQWFYFARYHSVASVFDKSMKREMIIEHMLQLGYKPVSFTRWAQLKRKATAAVRSGRA